MTSPHPNSSINKDSNKRLGIIIVQTFWNGHIYQKANMASISLVLHDICHVCDVGHGWHCLGFTGESKRLSANSISRYRQRARRVRCNWLYSSSVHHNGVLFFSIPIAHVSFCLLLVVLRIMNLEFICVFPLLLFYVFIWGVSCFHE